MEIRNFTPHAVTVFDEDGDPLVTLAPAGLARAKQTAITVGEIDLLTGSVPIKKMTFGAVEGLPETAADDEYFIVSAITAQAAEATNHPLRARLLVVADPVRNGDGQIVGCRSFSTFCADDELDAIIALANTLTEGRVMLDEIKRKDLLIWAMREADFYGEQNECELPEDEIALTPVTDAFAEQMRDHVVDMINDRGLVEVFDWEELDGDVLEKKITEEARAYCYALDYSEIAEFWATVAIESIKYGDF